MAKKVATQVEALRVELQAPPRVSLLEDAVVTGSGDSKRPLMAAMIGFGALVVGIFGVSWRELRSGRIRSTDEVVQELGMRCVGALPSLSDQRQESEDPDGTLGDDSDQVMNEFVAATRARLLYAARVEPFQVLMITSAQAGEGKTSLAGQLATSLARAGRKTLLLDCDLRRPSAHRLFDLEPEPGFCEVLRGEIDIADAVRPTSLTGLALIPGGKWDNQVGQALAQEGRVRAILERLRGQYDFIVVDSSPVLAAADSLWIAQYVDTALFSILYDVSHLPSVQAAYQELSGLGIRILGAVLGGAPTKHIGLEYTKYATESAR
jgi:capsular exopolysaccharide synthesis family protein